MHSLILNDKQASIAIEMYSRLRQEKVSMLEEVKRDIDDIDDIVNQLKLGGNAMPISQELEKKVFEDGYNMSMTWLKKIEHVLNLLGIATTSEIVDYIIKKYEPSLNRQTAMRSVSSTVSQNTEKTLIKNTNERGENTYKLSTSESEEDDLI